ncbi:hypothetical protein FHS55_002140 [Angulomicrobium tetraedrale]|uniref:Zinc finger CHC2-type domain-containing protein n=1 Tax=Ancylobacter tetraedralis TaxID=217068 RepID=A0A839Z9X5_9HYPH|nr:CHC2 zinc finger domain-containing protein [Ancylobacter tetraedralis]MBB3771541.1 hypothetical protein [Ancylobacter tetraedralis]
MITPAALEDLRRRNPVPEVAGKWVSLRRGTKTGRMVGPCPLHSKDPHAKDSTSFECWSDGWVCAHCCKGGDVIRLVEEYEHKSFREAVEWLGGPREVDDAEEARRAAERAEKQAQQEVAQAGFRNRERDRLYGWWQEARPVAGSPAEQYLLRRGCRVPPGARLRFRPDHPYMVHEGRDERGRDVWRAIHRGPAMIAAITAPTGHFLGLHITWLDLDQPKGKAVITHPETGEVLQAKKMRGSKQGGQIELLRCASPTCLIIGEGIETVLSIYAAMVRKGRPLDGIAFWAAGDLGNLAGKAAAGCRVRHPIAKDAAGRTLLVPGAEPDLASKAVTIPNSVFDLRLLGDGDSDPFTTRLAMQRAEARHACAGRRILTAWPEPGRDFNSMLQGGECAA